MASAVAGFMQTFGIDEPSGCYDDIELTDTVVLWGANMAEMHPMLWARIVDQRLRSPEYRVFNLTTFANRSSDGADVEIVFKPNTDLAIWNYIAREIVARNAVDQAFVEQALRLRRRPDRHRLRHAPDTSTFAYPAEKDTQARERVVVLTREEAIARRLDPSARHERRQETAAERRRPLADLRSRTSRRRSSPTRSTSWPSSPRATPTSRWTPSRPSSWQLADHYADPSRKVVSYWTMGFNQHTRGTWVNEQAYMVHLLTGKQAKPGNGAFSLTGQPSACGTAREVGTFSHRLPADMVVDNPAHRAVCRAALEAAGEDAQPEGGQPHHRDDARPRGRQGASGSGCR